MKTTSSVDRFIAEAPEASRTKLVQIRELISSVAKDATETINYGIPTFQWFGNLVHFSGYERHIGFYPGASGIAHFSKELSGYRSAKGSVQFPLSEPLPAALIKKIVLFRIRENEEKQKAKTRRICPLGHEYFKTSDCPVCPACEKAKNKKSTFPVTIAAPARRALEEQKIDTLKKLASRKENEIASLHGMGPSTMIKLRKALKDAGLSFRK